MRVTRRMMWDLWMRGCVCPRLLASALQIYVCVVGLAVSRRGFCGLVAPGWSDEARSGQSKTAPALWEIGKPSRV